MTCVIGLVHEDSVYFGSDSITSDGHRKQVRQDSKIVKVNGSTGDHQLIAGVCGSWRVRDVLQWEMGVQPPRVGTEIEEWVRTDFLSDFRRKMKDAGAMHIDNSVESMNYSTFLLAAQQQLYFIDCDLNIGPCDSWGAAVGSGCDVAHGILYDRRDEKDPMPKILAALRAASALITTVMPPFHVFRFRNNELDRLHEGE